LTPAPAVTQAAAPALVAAALAAPLAVPAGATQVPAPGFWARLFGAHQDIRVEVQRGNTRIVVSWPVQAAPECSAWLRSLG
jgi:transposase